MDLELHQLARELLAQKIAEQKSQGILESLHIPKRVQRRDRMPEEPAEEEPSPAPAGGHRYLGYTVSFSFSGPDARRALGKTVNFPLTVRPLPLKVVGFQS